MIIEKKNYKILAEKTKLFSLKMTKNFSLFPLLHR